MEERKIREEIPDVISAFFSYFPLLHFPLSPSIVTYGY